MSRQKKSVALDKKQLSKEIAGDLRRKARLKVALLREQVRLARRRRSQAIRDVRAQCRAARVAARDRERERREALRAAILRERAAAAERCRRSREEARNLGDIERAQAELAAERQYQADIRRIEQGNRARSKARSRATSAERRAESDDEVLANIDPQLHALWRKVRRSIRGNARMSRTEEFAKYVEEHPEETFLAIDDAVDAVVEELVKRLDEAEEEYDLHVEGVPF